MKEALHIMMFILFLVTIVPALIFLFSFITMWAWNLVMPALFHLPSISLLQAFALNLLIGIIKGIFKVTVKK